MTTQITINGREFTVTHDQPADKYKFETPYLLTPVKPRGAQTHFRLLRNQVRPQHLFPVGNNPFSSGGLPKWWVREVSPGIIEPLS